MTTRGANPVLCLVGQACRDNADRPAVEDGYGNRLSYAQLDEKSTEVAQYLSGLGARPGEIIPLLTSSCPEMVIGVLGIIKAGCTYVPIDRVQWPQNRIDEVLKRCNPRIALYTGGEIQIENCETVRLPLCPRKVAPRHENSSSLGPEIMCIIFTSGTTNKPKAVQIRSTSVAALVSSPAFNYDVQPGDRVLLVLSVAFDACMATLFSTLCNGGTVMLANTHNFQQVGSRCNILVLTPSILESLRPPTLFSDYEDVQKIILGGETPSRALLKSWSVLQIPIWIAYGPTEATCAVLTECLERSATTGDYYPNRFGRVIPGGSLLLLDDDNKVVEELNNERELCIAGECLAAGYWKDEEKTRTHFVVHKGERVYRTGDIAKWVLSDQGSLVLELCGRRDRVAKVRGFLVNLDHDVDACLMQLDENVKAAFSLVIDGRLCTAIVCAGSINEKQLRVQWRKRSPPYMISDHICSFESLPLTPNGKIEPKGVARLLEAQLPTPVLNPKRSYASVDEVIVDKASSLLGLPAAEICLEASLVSQGLHSLAAAKLSAFCHQRGFEVPVEDILTQPSVAHLITVCRERRPQVSLPYCAVDAVPEENVIIPFHQKLILASLNDPSLYCVKHVSHHSTIDIPKLKAAWMSVVAAEPGLRTVFKVQDTIITRHVGLPKDVRWMETVVGSHEDIQREIALLDQDTGLGSQFRVLNFRGPKLPPGESMLVWAIHHALIDGFSASLIFERLDALVRGEDLESSPAYTLVARDVIQYQALIAPKAETFWKQQTEAYPTASSDLLLPESSGENGKGYATYTLSQKLNLSSIDEIARKARVTPAAIFFAAWALVLGLYTGSDTVLFGAVLSGRNLPFEWAQRFVGALINTLPLRMRVARTDTPVNLLQSVHRTVQALSSICAARPPADAPKVTTALVIQEDGLKDGSCEIRGLKEPYVHECVDIPLLAAVEGDKLRFLYHQGSMSGVQIEGIASAFLNSIVALTDPKIHYLKGAFARQISPPIRQRVLEAGNISSPATRMDSQVHTVPAMFYSAAARNPTNIAVDKAGSTLTYHALAEYVTIVSHVVQALVPQGEAVAVLADRSINWVIAAFAALAANTIYCPLDSTYESAYRSTLLRRSKAKLLLVPRACTEVQACGNVITLGVDQILSLNIEPSLCSQRPPGPSDTAYLCFTSGSTGQPKGVLCEHRGVVALQSSPEFRLHAQPGVRVAQFLASGFDGCIYELFGALCYGGTLVLRTHDHDSFSHLKDVDAAMINPSVAGQLNPCDYPNLKYWFLQLAFGGEPVPETIADRWASGRMLYNAYGPTEASIQSCQQLLLKGKPVTIGRPLPTTRLYILNDHLELQPPGTVGDIYVAGVQVSKGYLDQPEATARDFMLDPFATWSSNERMYRTGDLGFWDKDWNLHCCGRRDRQVKLRGYRVSLDGIATIAHQSMSQIHAAIAVIQNERIALWVEPATVCIHTLHQKLSTALPPHAVPRNIRAVEKIPLSTNGKLHAKALLETPDMDPPDSLESVPDTSVKKIIEDEWRKILGQSSSVTVRGSDEFLVHGGDSLLQLTLAARMKQVFRVPITPTDIIQSVSFDDIVALVEGKIRAKSLHDDLQGELNATASLGQKDVSSAELWWVYRYLNSQCQSGFNVPYVANLSPSVDRHRLATSLETVFNRHRILRSRFEVIDGTAQRVIADEPIVVSIVPAADVDTFVNLPFDITRGPLVRAIIAPSLLAITISHIVCDLTALKVILQETATLYGGDQLQPVEREYFDITTWNQPIEPAKAEFWTKSLEGLVLDYADKAKQSRSYRGTSVVGTVPARLYRKLVTRTIKRGSTLHQLGLTVSALVLHILSQRNHICLGSPYINRLSTEDQTVVGLCLEPLPIRIRIDAMQCTADDLIQQVRQASQSTLAHAVPWSTLLAHLGLPVQTDSSQIFDCVVTFHDDRAKTQMLPIDGISHRQIYPEGSKFAMLFEWHALPERLQLRLEYDSDHITPDIAQLVQFLSLHCAELVLNAKMKNLHIQQELKRALKQKCRELRLNIDDVRNVAREFLVSASKSKGKRS
ncbi:hypothetical protein HK57_00375 [Aspergillus ustus]|uniref:Nonribosomal peptide synthetase pboA n=1 Tax=Aspergillus ustus TaxID=40382 RepID=PBOA_ASPUT|nr:RecName: Full=Nonribosomal peptide synthetase pboA; Short=NRPS pboA; AltName: Full=Protubonine biosynthesis cluster protein A [Aspergillus ustus]KIA75848.1 hypothetical protein HK57_00375 [Aspergillus ustus]